MLWLQRALFALEALLIGAFQGVLRVIGPDRSVRLMSAVMSRIGPLLPKSKNLRENLAIMFPGSTREEMAALERATWGQSGALMGDVAHLDTICGPEADERIEIVVKGTSRLFSDGGPAVLVTAHVGNFHLATYAADRLGARLTALYRPDSNPYLDRMIQRRRLATRADLVPRDGGIRALMRALDEGKAVGLVVDQRFDRGEMVPFFGVDCLTNTAPARLALRYGCELVAVQVRRLGAAARFRVTFHEPIVPRNRSSNAREQALDMTAQVNACFEQWIRERPEQWFEAKRRWHRGAPIDAPAPPSAPAGPPQALRPIKARPRPGS